MYIQMKTYMANKSFIHVIFYIKYSLDSVKNLNKFKILNTNK